VKDEEQELELWAYVDGELDPAARAAFEARLQQDVALRQRVQVQQRLRGMLGASYAPVTQEPVPERLNAALAGRGTDILSFAEARQRREPAQASSRRPAWLPNWYQLGGMAASVMLGLVIGYRAHPGLAPGNGLQAQGGLATALDTKLSGEQVGVVRLGISFNAKGGGYCRSFSTDASVGLACRQADSEVWQLRQLMPNAAHPGSDYRTAASPLPPALLSAIDELREGDALDAAQEAEARAKGWR